jgi:hypothetical protein
VVRLRVVAVALVLRLRVAVVPVLALAAFLAARLHPLFTTLAAERLASAAVLLPAFTVALT